MRVSKNRHNRARAKRVYSSRRTAIPLVVVLLGSITTVLAVRAYSSRVDPPTIRLESAAAPAPQGPRPQVNPLRGRLFHQPEAAKLGRTLGKRFFASGREVTSFDGSLMVGAERYQIHLVRIQQEDGEHLTLALDGGSPSRSWNAAEGAQAGGRLAASSERVMIERLALDSPDQFVLAQLRGASYYTVARNVMPSSAGGSENYDGPLWDVIRVGEPQSAGVNAPLSRWRTFHINTATGLIDRCISQEEDTTTVAEFSGWVDQFGEKVPTRITWSQEGKVVMELSVNSVAYGARQ